MAKYQPSSVSNVCDAKHRFLVTPAIGEVLSKEQLTDCERDLGRIFIMRVEKRKQLGKYQPGVPDPEKKELVVPPGTLYLELDQEQFKKAAKLLLDGRAKELPPIEWKLDEEGVVGALVIGNTQFHAKRLSDIRELIGLADKGTKVA